MGADKFEESQILVKNLKARGIRLTDKKVTRSFCIEIKKADLARFKGLENSLKGFFSYKPYDTTASTVKVYSAEADLKETEDFIKIVGGKFEEVKYSWSFLENKEVPMDAFFELTSRVEPIHLVNDKEALAKVAHIPSITPERFEKVCHNFVQKQTEYFFFREDVKDFFPYYPQPNLMVARNDGYTMRMSFSRGIFITQRYNTQANVTAATWAKEKVKDIVTIVEDAARQLLE